MHEQESTKIKTLFNMYYESETDKKRFRLSIP